jgi:predicted glycogen debranching enzyme
MRPPVGRMVLLSKLDERIAVGGEWLDLATNQFPGAIHPRGFERLERFRRHVFPRLEFGALSKGVAAIHGENTTVIWYQANVDLTLELRPFIAGRDYHSLVHANDGAHPASEWRDDGVFVLPPLYLAIPRAEFHAAPDWWRNFEYAIEEERGLESHEDLFTPGTFVVQLAAGERLAVIASTIDPANRDGQELFDAEMARRKSFMGFQEMIADQFIVRRGDDRRTIIAGYHWFTDWGRDAMIALPGLCLCTGRFDDARRILLAFAESVSEGLLPNRFPDGGEAPEYNTADATLWFFVAAQKYLDYTGDDAFLRDVLLPVLRDIMAWHRRGTRHNIHEDDDGLLVAGTESDQLTWMDAKVGDWVVTPRHGKPVEINALWFNAQLILAGFERRFGTAEKADDLEQRAERVRERFRQVFWNENAGYLFDVIEGDRRDASIRPNAIFAISLPHPLLGGDQAERVLRVVEEQLLTPRGLRTLSPRDPRFIGVLKGSQRDRDAAYHQGTVWPWLLGPFITALVRVRGDEGKRQGGAIMTAFMPHLSREACVGAVSEIFDGSPPHTPRGCVAQAWSAGEIIRVIREDIGTLG